ELFGGDSDDPDSMGMDVDGMLGMGGEPSGDLDKAVVAAAAVAAQAAKEQNKSNSSSSAAAAFAVSKETDTDGVPLKEELKPKKELIPTKPDIQPDEPPGDFTMNHYPARAPTEIASDYQRCDMYDVVPTIAFINAYQIHAVAATADMRWMFTGGEDGYVKKWDFNASVNGKQLLTQGQRHSLVDGVTKAGIMVSYWDHADSAHPSSVALGPETLSPVYSMAVHSQGMWMVSGMKSGNIGLWTIRHDEGRRVAVLGKHTKPVSVLRTTPDEYGLVSGAWDRACLYWDLNTGRVARVFNEHSSQISSIEFQPQAVGADTGALMMTTGIDGQCLLWDMRVAKPVTSSLKQFEPALKTPPWASSACWSRDGRRIYVGRRNNTVDEYDIAAGIGGSNGPVRTLRLPMNSGPVTAVAMMANGRNLVCASTDNVRIWDLDLPPVVAGRSTVPFQIIPGHHGGCVSGILVDEASRYLVTTSGNRGWDGVSNNVCLGYEVAPVLK
ncbi:Transcription factor spt8, partial [Kickxella alabastrina]